MCQRIDADDRSVRKIPDRLVPADFRTHFSADIDDAWPAGNDQTVFDILFGSRIFILDGTDPGFAQIIPAGPHEIAGQIGNLFDQLPVLIKRFRQCFGADEGFGGISSGFFLIPGRGIVIACHIKNRGETVRDLIRDRRDGCQLHDGPELIHQHIEK